MNSYLDQFDNLFCISSIVAAVELAKIWFGVLIGRVEIKSSRGVEISEVLTTS
jgi:hypothetical protein